MHRKKRGTNHAFRDKPHLFLNQSAGSESEGAKLWNCLHDSLDFQNIKSIWWIGQTDLYIFLCKTIEVETKTRHKKAGMCLKTAKVPHPSITLFANLSKW